MNAWGGRHKGVLLTLAVLVLAASSGLPPTEAPPGGGGGYAAARSPPVKDLSPLSLVASDSNPFYTNAAGNGLVDRLAQEAFTRLGYPVHLGVLPSERAIRNVQEGVDDGDMLRIGGLSAKYPNVIQVAEPWLDMQFSAFTSRGEGWSVTGWNSLRNLNVGIIKGWKVAEKNTQGFPFLLLADNAERLFDLLRKKRVDVIVYDSLQGRYFIKKLGLEGVRLLEPPLATHHIYLYLNQKHAALAEPVAAAIRSMKQDGTHQRLLTEGMAELMR